MLRLIEDREAKAAAQAELEARIRERLADQGVRNIGFPSGNTDEVVYAEGAGGLWAAFTPLKAAAVPRQWNAFGLYDPSLHAQMITVEINVPTADNSARVAGFYARDPQTDRVYLMHDGSVGGGRPGVGRDAFLSWTRATTVDVVRSDGVVRSGVVVGAVEVDDFVPHLRRFVMRVRRFKAAVAAGALDTVEAADAIAEWEAFNRGMIPLVSPRGLCPPLGVSSLMLEGSAFVAGPVFLPARQAQGACGRLETASFRAAGRLSSQLGPTAELLGCGEAEPRNSSIAARNRIPLATGDPMSAPWLGALCESSRSKGEPVDPDGRRPGIDEAQILGGAGAG